MPRASSQFSSPVLGEKHKQPPVVVWIRSTRISSCGAGSVRPRAYQTPMPPGGATKDENGFEEKLFLRLARRSEFTWCFEPEYQTGRAVWRTTNCRPSHREHAG